MGKTQGSRLAQVTKFLWCLKSVTQEKKKTASTLTQACATNVLKMSCDMDLPNLTAGLCQIPSVYMEPLQGMLQLRKQMAELLMPTLWPGEKPAHLSHSTSWASHLYSMPAAASSCFYYLPEMIISSNTRSLAQPHIQWDLIIFFDYFYQQAMGNSVTVTLCNH